MARGGLPSLSHQLQTLQDSEAVLLVDDHQAGFFKSHFFFQEGVGADDQLGIALGYVAPDFPLAILFQRSR